MSVLRSPVFIICCIIFIIHQVMQKMLDLSFAPFDRYLDNLLAMPIILTLLLAERRWLFKRGNQYTLSLLEIAMATLFILMISEIIFPALSSRFTADWKDVIFYIAGSLIFYLVINKALAPGKTKI